MENNLELTREFFAKLIRRLAAREREKDTNVKLCLERLSDAIAHAGGGCDSLGTINDDYGGNIGSCCDVCELTKK